MSSMPSPEISIQRLRPPIGGIYHFAAKVGRLYTTRNGSQERIRLPFVEVWGETEDDARQKADAMIARILGDASTARVDALRLPAVPTATGEQTGGR